MADDATPLFGVSPDGSSMRRLEDRGVWRRLLRRIGARARPGQDPEDLLQAAYVRLHEHRQKAVIGNEEGFLVRTAVNLSIDDWRRRRLGGEPLDPEVAAAVADPAPRQDEVLAHRVRLERVRQRIGRMPPRTREVFLLHRLEGLKYREIAARLGISLSAVEKHVAKAAALLAGAEGD